MKTPKVFQTGSYLRGDYEFKLEIKEAIYKDLEGGGEALIVEFKVIESTDPEVPVGAERSWFQMQNQSFAASALEFLVAACGFNPKDQSHVDKIAEGSEALMEILLPPHNKFKGREVFVKTTDKVKKEFKAIPEEQRTQKMYFTNHAWSPASAPLG